MKRRVREPRGKVRLELIPPAALIEEAKALDHGNQKSGRGRWNWRTKGVSASDQIGGALRHIARFLEGEQLDASGAHHLGHARARLGILIDAQLAGTLVDDRPPAKRRRKRGRV